MRVAENIAKRRLDDGGVVLGLGLRQARTADIGMIARTCGFDFLFLDSEHNAMNEATAADISVAALGQGITPLVRVSSKEPFHSTRILDNGAQGVIVPHVDTVDEARTIAAGLRYPPRGRRSISRASPQVAFANVPLDEFMRDVNEQTLVIAMLESPQSIDQADEIAAVDGIDGLMIGTNDLCAEMGIHGQFGHEKVVDAYERMIAACKNHGKYPGMAGVRADALMQRYIEMGSRLVLAGVDLPLMMEAANARTKFLRGIAAGLAART